MKTPEPLYAHPSPEEVKRDEALLRYCKNAFHGIKLCSINSMSSRSEMIRLADEAIAKLAERLGEK